MSRLKQGDRVVCKLSLSKLVNSYSSNFDEKRVFEIIGLDKQGYCVYVPHYWNLFSTSTIQISDCKTYNIHTKFLGEEMLYIVDSLIFSIESKLDGCFCSRCKEFFYQASPPNDGNFTCWSCKNNPYR